jgi:phosphate transport system substrate-binding protein
VKRTITLALVLLASACSKQRADDASAPGGIVAIDGSSTVYPLTEAVAEEFHKTNPAKVTIGVSGTGGGFKKLCAGEIAIADASRPIKAEEAAACAAKSVAYVELPVAYDGLAVVVNPQNTWVDHVTVAELKALWAPEAQDKVKKWSDVRAGWPEEEIHLFGAGTDSGTYDYFTQAIVGKEHSSRGDYTASEDDNVLVQGVATDRLALGFFGLGYVAANAGKLKPVPVDDGKDENGKGPILPTTATVLDGTYQPLSRPLFVYVAAPAAARPEVRDFVDAYLQTVPALSSSVGYVPLPAEAYALASARFAAGKAGSVFGGGGSRVGVSIVELLKKE